jgi:ADP-heptose:LPS heptosyltransferase
LSRVVGVRRVAIAKVGGIGDNLQLVPLIKGVRRKYKNNVVIDLYVEKFGEIFGFVDGINDIKMTRFGQPNIVKSLINEYDEVFDVRYVSKAYGKDVKDTEYYKKYAEFYDRWVELNPRLEDLNEHIVNIMIKSLGYEDYCTIDDLKLDRPVAQYKGLEKDSYIVVAPEYGLIKTKQYSSEFWLDLIEKVSEKIKVVIIGKTKDFEIIGYDNIVDMRGKTSLIQVLELINSAKGVIAIEGGIGWVSKFVGKKAIVLFASTPVVCYGFKENINLTNNVCRPCWWSMPEPANCVLGEKYCKNCVSVEVVLSKLKEL